MSPETVWEDLFFPKTPKSDYYLRITDIFVRLKLKPDHKNPSWRQEIPERFVEPALNGKHSFIKDKSFFAPLAFYHAGEEEGRVWIRLSRGNKAIKFTLTDGENFAESLIEEKRRGEWRPLQNLDLVKAEELERVIFCGEVLTGIENPTIKEAGLLDWTGTPQINRLPGAVIGNKGI